MDELMISGRRYVSSARAAKEHGYHSDYIGQLIRGGKVKGQKVGRAWYVDAESLAIYLGKEVSQAIAEHQAEVQKEATATVHEVAAEAVAEPEAPLKEKIITPEPEPQATIEPEPELVPEPVVAEGTQQEIVENEEERRVPISKVGEKLRPQRTSQPQVIIEIPRKFSGLTYVSDDEPLLPEIRKSKIVSLAAEEEILPQQTVDEDVQIKIEERPSRPSFVRQGIALTALGVIVLVVVTAASSLLVFNMSVGSTQTAGVQFVLPQ